jgi:hypothetical protein
MMTQDACNVTIAWCFVFAPCRVGARRTFETAILKRSNCRAEVSHNRLACLSDKRLWLVRTSSRIKRRCLRLHNISANNAI